MQRKDTLLLVDNDVLYLTTLKQLFELEGYAVRTAASISEARRILRDGSIQLVVTDLRARDDTDVMDQSGLAFACSISPEIPKIILTSHASFSSARDALSPGPDGPAVAVDFISKEQDFDELLQAVVKAFKINVRFDYSQFKIGGSLTDDDASVYVTRTAEREVLGHLRKMDYLLIIEPRQQGKTSLINYLLRSPALTQTQTVLVYIYVATLDGSSQSVWYESFCSRILEQLTPILPNAVWPSIPLNKVQWRAFLVGLAKTFDEAGCNLVITLDEIGTAIPDATGFFRVLRDVFDSRQAQPQLKRITFLLAGAFHPRDLVDDDRDSPFNIARRVRLRDFTLEEVRFLITNLALSDDQADALSERVFHWTAGQPYLTHQICAFLSPNSTEIDVDNAVERLRKKDDENHMPPLLRRLNKDTIAIEYLDRISRGVPLPFHPVEDEVQGRLELLGMIREDGDGNCTIRNRIYREAIAMMSQNVLNGTFPQWPENVRHTEESISDQSGAPSHLSLKEEQSDARSVEMMRGLAGIQSGFAAANAFHSFILSAIECIFKDALSRPVKEEKIHESRKRVDIVFTNSADHGFFLDLRLKYEVHCPLIFFECKNYSGDPENPELDQLTGRFSDKRGMFGVIVCRTIEDRKKMLQRCKDVVHDNRGYPLVIDDTDINHLLRLRANGAFDSIDEYMDAMFRQLVL